MTADVVTTERKKPTPERFASGELRPKKAKDNASPASPPVNGRICYICNTTVPGDTFTALPDEKGITRSVHVPVYVVGGKAAEVTPDCQNIFLSRIADAERQRARQHQEDLALAASKRQQAELPQRGYDCTVEDCKTKDGQTRFFDSANGRDLHARKAHKGDHDA